MAKTFWVVAGLGLWLAACGPDDDDGGAAGGSGGGAAAGTGGGAAAGGSGGTTAGSGGTTGGAPSGGGSGGTDPGTLRCTGTYGEPELLFTEPEWLLGSPTLTGDELELYYTRETSGTGSADSRVVVRKRATSNTLFGDAADATAVTARCMSEGMPVGGVAISQDGLRLYVSCSAGGSAGPLVLGTRPDRQSEFTFGATAIGQAGFTLGLARDELSMYSVDNQTPTVLARARREDVFGPATPVLGLEAATLMSAEPGPDNLTLFGATSDPGIPGSYWLTVARRASATAPFEAPITLGLPTPPAGASDGSPAFGPSCRTLYFLRRTATPNAPSTYSYALYVARR